MKKIRVLIAKLGLDGHDRGAKIVARMLRDAGMEVIYLGKLLRIEEVLQAAADEDVDVIGLSFLSGEHLAYTREFIKKMKQHPAFINQKPLIILGGVIPRSDIPELIGFGVDEVFISGTHIKKVIEFINGKVFSHTSETRGQGT